MTKFIFDCMQRMTTISLWSKNDFFFLFWGFSAVLFEEAVILGSDTDVMSYGPFCPNSQSGTLEKLPYYSVERTVSVWGMIYLQHSST